jgi:hypothetical protein
MIPKLQPEPVVHSSLGLQELCQRLQDVPTCNILELGPVRSGNIEFWSRFNPLIFIADLRSSLPLPVSPIEDSEPVKPDWRHLLNLPEDRKFDVILAWDLLNYLDISSVSSLIQFLKSFCLPGAVLFTLIYDQKQMPEKITVYRVSDESHLIYESSGSELRACPRHQPRAIEIVMSNFRTSNSFRLRNGIVEYLFIYEGEGAG